MNVNAIIRLRAMLAADQAAAGLWVTLESASITEMAVVLGLDWVVVDAEHGHLDWKEILEHVRAAARSETAVLVRLAELSIGLVKRALDIGADGVVIPWIESPGQLEAAVSFARYPPAGRRGIGGERATCWGARLAESVAEANSHVLVVPIVESVAGGQAIDKLCQVPGVEIVFLGPADYSATAGYAGQWEGPGVADQLLAVKDAVRRHGKHCGVVATSPQNLLERRDQGFRMLGLGPDVGLLWSSMAGRLAVLGREPPATPRQTPAARAASAEEPLANAGGSTTQPGGEMAAALLAGCVVADRLESMNSVGSAARLEIDAGVSFRPLVGDHNQARNLTTGLVVMAPGAELAWHLHPHAEAVTVLEGHLDFEVEGRRYTLRPLDNICIPREVAHAALNPSADQPAVLHIAMASHSPQRTLVDPRSVAAAPAFPSTGSIPERVNRHDSACYELSPGARFQDYYNRELGCPEMSGGYGLFQPGARLPCHLHDFDESISIIQGTATCVVEGRRYRLSDNDTALCPRGCCHYFVNESPQPMAMLWVYAGPMPERIVLPEHRCLATH